MDGLLAGKYEIKGTLGQGAYGIVYLGWQADLGRNVAIKQLAPQMVADPAFLQQFRYEAQIMAQLDHPNCVKVFAFIEEDGQAYLVSEYIEGATLKKVIETSGTLAPEQSLGVLKGALNGLGYAHSLGLVHRDVKPDNIIADTEGTSKLADFGQAYFGGGPGAAGGLTGSPLYMSPEQASGGVVDYRSDLYSAGAVLYEFLTGRPPFVGETAIATMRMHQTEAVPDARRLNSKLPSEAAELLTKALHKDPTQRFQSANEMLTALEAAAQAGYGTDWERRAKITGLVGGAMAAGAAGLAAGVGVAGAHAGGAAAAGTATAGGGAAASGGVSSGVVVAGGVGVGAVATAAVVAYVVVTNAVFGHNLIKNGNAEGNAGATNDSAVVAPADWKTEGNFTVVEYGAAGVPGTGDPGPPDRGKNLFAGGPDNSRSKATQTVDVSQGGGGIDSGSKRYTLSGYLGGFQDQEDNASVVITFQDAGGNSLGTARIGPVSSVTRRGVSALVKSEDSGVVPKGTRKIVVDIVTVRSSGLYNDGYADDISLTVN
jgi:tRNA A-37 threonylcarbamoyl transferase component Bud32